MAPSQHALPDDLILIALSFVGAKDLLSFQSTCTRYQNLNNVDDLWRELCKYRWRNWPMYRLYKTLNGEGEGVEQKSWKDRYQWVENDYRRTELLPRDLELLDWSFHFLPWAGGSPNGQSQSYFHEGRLYLLKYLWMYPTLQYTITNVQVDTDPGGYANIEDLVERAGNVSVGDVFSNIDFLGGMQLVRAGPLQAAKEIAQATSPRISTKQYLQISTFPIHYIARTSIGGWLVWNENVVFFTDGSPRKAELPDQLAMHIDMFRF